MNDKQPWVQVRGRCPNCRADRNAEVLAEDTQEGEDDAGGIWGKTSFSILRCLGCDHRYIRHVQACPEDSDPETGEVEEKVSYWPSHERRHRPSWLWGMEFAAGQAKLAALLAEVYAALDNNLSVLATIGMRTAFDCASQLLGADANQSFAEKLKELAAGNKIGGEEKEILSTLADAGNAAAHRGWKPTPFEIDSLMQALENFLERAFVLKHDLRRVGKNIPRRIQP